MKNAAGTGLCAGCFDGRYDCPDSGRALSGQSQKLGLLFTSNNQPMLPPPFPKQLFSLIDKPASTDEDGIVDHSLKLFKIIGSPGYVNHLEAVQTARKLYKRSYYPAGVLQQF